MTLFPLPPISQPVSAPKVETMGFLLALLLLPLYAGLSVTAPSCSRNVRIVGGNFTLSHGWTPGSLLTYICPLGKYPYPVSSQLCNSYGQWKSPGTSVVTRVTCKQMRCPAPVAFENGAYSPRLGSHPVGGNVSFECEDGYILRGSPVRRCRPNGMWDGETAICDSGAGHCPNPGIPIGAVRTGYRFNVGDRVKYRCSEKLILIGSEERECQANRVWSGTEPICRSSYSYDFPEDVAPVLDTSLSQLLGAANPLMQKLDNFGRRIQIQRSGHLNLYLLLDSSQSVSREDFAIFKESAQLMVDRIFSFGVNVSVGIVIFAKSPKVILSVTHKDSREEMEIAQKLEDIKYGDPDIGTGTNIKKAMMQIYEMMNNEMATFGERQKEWEKIRHVIILLTDGKSNMGGSPKEAVTKIKEVLNIRPICLPCTVGANLALRRSPASTCSDHENILLKKNEIPAHFVSLDDEIMDIVLKEENERTICLQAVSQAKQFFSNLTDVKQVVTDQFLCSGTGNDASPCKGESGGAVFLQKRYRYFQVGLVSWGLYNPCSEKTTTPNKVNRYPSSAGTLARDFHISVFRLQPWLRQHLKNVLRFLPLGPAS